MLKRTLQILVSINPPVTLEVLGQDSCICPERDAGYNCINKNNYQFVSVQGSLVTVGELFNNFGYGLAFRRSSDAQALKYTTFNQVKKRVKSRRRRRRLRLKRRRGRPGRKGSRKQETRDIKRGEGRVQGRYQTGEGWGGRVCGGRGGRRKRKTTTLSIDAAGNPLPPRARHPPRHHLSVAA
eukprot:767992-Hanusia_phi.AAC.3